ncbi:MAG: hypothetical protein GXX84_20735, partial [Acidobacteria bacterium]|nr:hypothetical protein [Acidobacteriota bacterium]
MTLRNTLSPYLKPVRHRTHLQYLFCFVLISFLAAFFPATDAFAQTARVTVGTASGLPGTTVNVSVGFTAGATPVSMLQFDLLYSAPLSYSSVATGQAAANAGKSAVGNQIAGGSRIVVFGLNQTGIGSGSVAVVQFNIAGVAPAGPATIAITGLVASDPNANPVQVSGVNGAVTVLPPPDTTPPVISGVSSSNITSNSARITWTTNEASDTQVEYGKTTSYGSSTTLNGSMVTSHSHTLSGLSANTTYHYRVKSKDAAGNLATSPDYTFKTAAAPDTT